MEDGVWRTIAGRRVFIKEGQSLSDAMKNSGKFDKENKKATKEEIQNEVEKEILDDEETKYTLQLYSAEDIQKSRNFDSYVEDKIGGIAFDNDYEITNDEVREIKNNFYKEYDKKRNKLMSKDSSDDLETYKNEHGGYTPQQIQEMIDYQNKMRNKIKEPREITSSTYKRAMNKTNKKVSSFVGKGLS